MSERTLTVFRRVMYKPYNNDWIKTVELSHISDRTDVFHKRSYMTKGLDGERQAEVESFYGNHRLDKMLRDINSKVRYYGKQVLMNL